MRQIVAGLTGDAEGSGDLANELSKADPVTLENGQESDDDISEPGDWVPDPVDADPGEMPSSAVLAPAWFPWWAVALSSSFAAPLELGWAGACPCSSDTAVCWIPPGKSSSKRRSSDIISLLVSIYGSKDLFINEYRTLLADRLLHQFNYSTER